MRLIRNTAARVLVICVACCVCAVVNEAVAQIPTGNDLPPRPQRAAELVETANPETTRPKKHRFDKLGGVVYRQTSDWEIKCDVYVPRGDGPFPAILAVHGGAWRRGSKLIMLRHAWEMAAAGYVVVAINYRHAPDYPFPAQVHDCKHAVRWMKANAKTYKINPDRIGAFGYSAGGHLVSMLGTSDDKDGLEGTIEPGLEKFNSRVNAVAAGAAPCEFTWVQDESWLLTYWLGGTPKQKPKTYRAASATTYVSSDDPPFFFFHGESDALVPCKSSQVLHELLIKSGVPSQHYIAPGEGHLATFSDMSWMEKAIGFFDSNLKD